MMLLETGTLLHARGHRTTPSHRSLFSYNSMFQCVLFRTWFYVSVRKTTPQFYMQTHHEQLLFSSSLVSQSK